MESDVRAVELLRHTFSILRIASGREHTTFGRLQLSSHICVLEQSPFSLSNIERRSAMLLRRSDGSNQEQFEGSRHRGRSGRKVLVFQTDDAWTVERPNRISRRLG